MVAKPSIVVSHVEEIFRDDLGQYWSPAQVTLTWPPLTEISGPSVIMNVVATSRPDMTLDQLYKDPSKQQVATVTFSVPIVDWGRRKAQMQTAYANKRLNDYVIAQDEVTFEQQILTQVRQFEMLYTQIEITKKSDEVALKRYNVAQNRYLIGKIDITNLNIALTEKDNAKRAYINALRQFFVVMHN